MDSSSVMSRDVRRRFLIRCWDDTTFMFTLSLGSHEYHLKLQLEDIRTSSSDLFLSSSSPSFPLTTPHKKWFVMTIQKTIPIRNRKWKTNKNLVKILVKFDWNQPGKLKLVKAENLIEFIRQENDQKMPLRKFSQLSISLETRLMFRLHVATQDPTIN